MTQDANTAALNAWMREQDKMQVSHAEEASARAKVFDKFHYSLPAFSDAIYDIADTLAYWNITDKEIARRAPAGGIHVTDLEKRRDVAHKAMRALQVIARKLNPTAEERAIRDLIMLEADRWIEAQVDEVLNERSEA